MPVATPGRALATGATGTIRNRRRRPSGERGCRADGEVVFLGIAVHGDLIGTNQPAYLPDWKGSRERPRGEMHTLEPRRGGPRPGRPPAAHRCPAAPGRRRTWRRRLWETEAALERWASAPEAGRGPRSAQVDGEQLGVERLVVGNAGDSNTGTSPAFVFSASCMLSKRLEAISSDRRGCGSNWKWFCSAAVVAKIALCHALHSQDVMAVLFGQTGARKLGTRGDQPRSP